MAILPGFGDVTENETYTYDNGMTITFAFPKAMPIATRNDIADACYSRLSPRPTAQDNALQKGLHRAALLSCFNNEVNKWKFVNGSGHDGQGTGGAAGDTAQWQECLRRAKQNFEDCKKVNWSTPEANLQRCQNIYAIDIEQCGRMYRGEKLEGAADDPCARCKWDDIPSCVYCVGDRLTQGLKLVGVNLLLGVAVLVGVYFLVKD